MTDSQKRRIQNLQHEIDSIERKVNRLLVQRQLLANQAAKILQEPTGPKVLTEEERKAQSLKDKAAYQQKFKTTQAPAVKRLNLFGDQP